MNERQNIQDMSLSELRDMVKAEEDRRKAIALEAAVEAARAAGYDLKDLVEPRKKSGRKVSGNSKAAKIFAMMESGMSASDACHALGEYSSASAYQAARNRGCRVVKGYLVKGDGL